ncbi:Mor transcription activator family protein [Thauera aminoaromatica]|uniref:Mu-like phage C protein, positive regulator of late transcription n=1 Tax=Thauera aminoaromatica S2 TaxID=1234381 RepID=N6YTP0_THASP|nr:Mor transcription activator family protein [Thauera aminoaromatica]ENO85543.1 Mu-like phage C protein, positive regulator of late transcription [Thauera aminoaromatica S2]
MKQPERFEDTFIGGLDAMLRTEISAAMGGDKAAVDELVDRITLKVCENFGGQQPYIGIGHQFRLNRIYHAIYEAFDGENYRELSARHGLSERHLRNVIEGVRKTRREAQGAADAVQALAAGASGRSAIRVWVRCRRGIYYARFPNGEEATSRFSALAAVQRLAEKTWPAGTFEVSKEVDAEPGEDVEVVITLKDSAAGIETNTVPTPPTMEEEDTQCTQSKT